MDAITAGIITTNAHIHGGVTSHVITVRSMLMSLNMSTQVIYAITRSAVEDNQAKVMSERDERETLGSNSLRLPRTKIPFMWTLSPMLYALQQIRKHDVLMVVCGSVHIGFSLGLLRLPYVLWVGTLWEDELLAQIENNDPHAQKIMNSPLYPVLKWQERQTLRRASYILTNSYHTANRIKEYVPEVATKVDTIITPLNTDIFYPDDEAQANSSHSPYILLTARINDPRKNIPLLLKAFRQVVDVHPDIKLVLAGEVPNDALLSKVAELGLVEAVEFPGYLTIEQLVKLYQGAKLYVLSSNQEGLGLVLLEAMACGTPVISTRSGGPENIVNDSVGRLVPLRDPNALAGAICDLLSDPEQLKSMRTVCVKHVKENYSVDAQRQHLLQCLQLVYPKLAR